MSQRPRGSATLFFLLLLELACVELLPYASDWIAVLIYFVLAGLMLLSLKPAKLLEDADPAFFVRFVFGATVIIGIAASLPWLPEAQHGFYPAFLRLSYPFSVGPEFMFDRVLAGAGFMLLSFSMFSIVRTLERRPSLTLLLVLNPVTLLLLATGTPWLISFGVFAFSVSLLIKGKNSWSLALLGFSFGFSLVGLVTVVLFLKHASAQIAKSEKWNVLAISAALYAAVAFAIGTVATGGLAAEVVRQVAGLELVWSTVSMAVGLLLLVAFLWRVEVSGKDSLIFALLLGVTILLLSTWSFTASALMLLVVLSAPFRSAPQLWLAFVAGVAALYPGEMPMVLWVIGALVFAALLGLQLRHAYRETGLFRTLELHEGAQA